MKWFIPQRNRGQMVEVAYTYNSEFVYERRLDRSDRTSQYYRKAHQEDLESLEFGEAPDMCGAEACPDPEGTEP